MKTTFGVDGLLLSEILKHTAGTGEAIASLANTDVKHQFVHLDFPHGVAFLGLGFSHFNGFLCSGDGDNCTKKTNVNNAGAANLTMAELRCGGGGGSGEEGGGRREEGGGSGEEGGGRREEGGGRREEGAVGEGEGGWRRDGG